MMRDQNGRPPAPTAAGEAEHSVSETGTHAYTSTPAGPEGEGTRAGHYRTISTAYAIHVPCQDVPRWAILAAIREASEGELDEPDPSTLAGAVAALLAAREEGREALLEAADDLVGYFPQGHPVGTIIRRIRALVEACAELPLVDAELGRLHGALSCDIRNDPRVAELAEQIRRDHGLALRNAARVHRGHEAKAADSLANHYEALVASIALVSFFEK